VHRSVEFSIQNLLKLTYVRMQFYKYSPTYTPGSPLQVKREDEEGQEKGREGREERRGQGMRRIEGRVQEHKIPTRSPPLQAV
jgi:hypothetical protein